MVRMVLWFLLGSLEWFVWYYGSLHVLLLAPWFSCFVVPLCTRRASNVAFVFLVCVSFGTYKCASNCECMCLLYILRFKIRKIIGMIWFHVKQIASPYYLSNDVRTTKYPCDTFLTQSLFICS